MTNVKRLDYKMNELQTILLREISDGVSYRLSKNEESIKGLAESMKESGLLQPPAVLKIDDNNFRIVFGHRRIAAARHLGWTEIQVMVIDGDNDQVFGVLENLQREDLTPREYSLAIKRLADAGQWTQDQLAAMLGQNKSTISRWIKLGSLVEHHGAAVSFTKLPVSTYFELLETPDLLILAEDGKWGQQRAREKATEFKKKRQNKNKFGNMSLERSKVTRRMAQRLENYEPLSLSEKEFRVSPFRFSYNLRMDIEAVIEKMQELRDKADHVVSVLRLYQSKAESDIVDAHQQEHPFESFEVISGVQEPVRNALPEIMQDYLTKVVKSKGV